MAASRLLLTFLLGSVLASVAVEEKKPERPIVEEVAGNPDTEPGSPDQGRGDARPEPAPKEMDGDAAPELEDEAAAEEADAEKAAIAVPVAPDPIQVFGWREKIKIKGIEEELQAKLDTGALTSSIHAEEKELFERDGKKWVRFFVDDPRKEKSVRTRLEAPLVRIARIKEPGGESSMREVVRLTFEIGERSLRGEFTLNNRDNMLSPVLIGRTAIKELGWVDSGRTYLADEKIFR